MPSDVVTIAPYFQVHPGRWPEVQAILRRFVEQTRPEPGCLYYDFTVNGDVVHCREAYQGAAGALAHLGNVNPLLQEMLQVADLARLEIHGPAAELEALKAPLAALPVAWFTYACGLGR
ncbi:MAG: putative quinol monooxygenase [Verrucomicrobiota bacterium]